MTTTIEETIENKKQAAESNADDSTHLYPIVPKEIMDIMTYLSQNSNIIFKSQQRNEPELQEAEKLRVALNVYKRNPQTFLIRFGSYLEEIHLQDFSRLSVADSDEEMHLMVKDYLNKLKTRQRDIKNRRFTALQKLIQEGEYFSEQEMMKRQPELYQELVGRYLTNDEKKQRDSYDVRNTTFSGILMHNLEQNQLNEIMEKAQTVITDNDVEETSSPLLDCSIAKSSLENMKKESDEVPLNCRKQWGNFDNEQIACSSSKLATDKVLGNTKAKPSSEDLIMGDERELLRQEFFSQMHAQFLTGQDKDFDYTTVDDNTQFDDLILINQDKEDKYFDESDEDDDSQKDENIKIRSESNMGDYEESEDELDAYMSHLNKHYSLQK